jgi:hypothetical protein
MLMLDRHRVARLIELAELERRATGPERVAREEDVNLFIKAVYDDASDAARAEFLARVKQMPTSAWPWSAVQKVTPHPGGVVYSPRPGALAPAALVLLRGQTDSADADPGNRIPEREQPAGVAWEPLHKALDLWDTATIKKWIAPQGWMTPGKITARLVPNAGGVIAPPGGGAPRPGNGGIPNGGTTPPGNGGADTSGGQIDPQPAPAPAFSWRHPAVIAAGATVATTIGVTLYALGRSRHQPAPLAAPATAVPPAAKEST